MIITWDANTITFLWSQLMAWWYDRSADHIFTTCWPNIDVRMTWTWTHYIISVPNGGATPSHGLSGVTHGSGCDGGATGWTSRCFEQRLGKNRIAVVHSVLFLAVVALRFLARRLPDPTRWRRLGFRYRTCLNYVGSAPDESLSNIRRVRLDL